MGGMEEIPDGAEDEVDTSSEVRDVEEDEAEGADEPEEVTEEEEEESSDDGLPKGVQRRLSKLTRKRKEAEARAKELEAEVEKLRARSGDEKLYFNVAKKHGILPELLDARTVKGLDALSEVDESISALRDVLDDMEDSGESEVELGGKTVTRGAVRKRLRELEAQRSSLREDFGDVPKELGRRVAKLLKLGLAAEKAAAEQKQRKRVRPDDEDEDEDEPESEKPQRRKQKRAVIGLEHMARDRRGKFKDPDGALDAILDSFV